MEPHARTNQMLPQIATLIRIELGARIIEVMVFDKSGELRGPVVICACDHLPREVRVTFAPASVEYDITGFGIHNLGPRRFGILNADSAPDIRLEFSKRESPDEVRHERARIDPRSHVALC